MEAIQPKRHALLFLIVAGYFLIAVAYGRWVPAFEGNDEIDHVANIEFILEQKRLYPLRLEKWHETHQPPLYYLLGAAWQRLLGVPAFKPVAPTRTTGEMTAPTLQLAYVHSSYTEEQRTAAMALYKLRLLSTLFGLGTVLLTYAAAFSLTQRVESAAAAAGFVAFLPKFTVISAAVTNDSLVVMLCSLGLALALLYRRQSGRPLRRGAISLALGLTGGAALITKFNSLPVFCFLTASLLVLPGFPFAERARNLGLALVGWAVTSGWWLAQNFASGKGLLGQKGANRWLNEQLPGLIARVSWFDQERFLNFLPSQLFQSIWYIGGWNQFVLPFGINLVFTLLAGICCFAALEALLRGGTFIRRRDPNVLLMMGCCLMALAAVYIIARTTTQGQGRVAYVGLSAFAILAVLGGGELFSKTSRARVSFAMWPLLLLALNAYVFLRFVIPFSAR
jgi:4-amino-4-deoxy-L-arabinose transferase-like glycosyltransferase